MKTKVGLLTTHPVQYYAPWFKHLDKKLDLEVFYTVKQTPKGQADAGFGVEFDWDINLLEGYKYRWLKNISKKPNTNTFFGSDTPEIYKIVNNKKFDAFLIIGWSYKSAIQTVIACKRNGVPIFMRGDSHLLTERSFVKKILKFIPYRIFLPMMNHLYVGKLNKEYLVHYGVPENKLFFVPHFVDNQFFSQQSQKCVENKTDKKIREIYNIPENVFVVLFVGKLIEKKRPKDLIDAAIKIFKSSNDEIHIIFVGDGPLRQSLQTQSSKYKDRIHFAGFVNQTELPCYYTASDVLVLPSDGRETWGLVVNEAMACGLPSIVSDKVGCAYNLVEDGKTGFVFKMGNIDSLKHKIIYFREIIKDKKTFISENVHNKIKQYSMEKASKNLLNIIEAIKR